MPIVADCQISVGISQQERSPDKGALLFTFFAVTRSVEEERFSWPEPRNRRRFDTSSDPWALEDTRQTRWSSNGTSPFRIVERGGELRSESIRIASDQDNPGPIRRLQEAKRRFSFRYELLLADCLQVAGEQNEGRDWQLPLSLLRPRYVCVR